MTWPIGPCRGEFATGLPASEQAVLHANPHPTFHGVNEGAVGDTVAWSTQPVFSVVTGHLP